MNRTLKFRAWDKKEKHFVYFELYQGANNHTPPIYNWAELEPWEQFTGLLDSKGKEIYEGDIVEHETGALWKVYFASGVGAFRLESPEETDFSDMEEGMRITVIGNVYENPELL